MDVGNEQEKAPPMSDAKQLNHQRRLRSPEIEKVIVQAAIDLKEIHVLDGIDDIPDPSGFRIRSHDLHGPLPDGVIVDTGDRYPVLDKVAIEAAKLIAMVRLRRKISEPFPDGVEFLLPTSTVNGKTVGIRIGACTVLTEAETFLGAYKRLARRVTR